MATTALYSAATGLRALSTRIDVVANNLANAETTAFKGSRMNFEDLFYLTMKQPGTVNSAGDVSPGGIQVGLGTKISNTQLDLTQGSLENTGRPLDLGIQGHGFFAVKILNSVGNGIGYTRNGNFVVNKNNELVLNIGDGYKLIPPVAIPPNATDITIGIDGTISVLLPNQTVKQNAGTLQLTQFINPQGLKLEGGSIFTETESSGAPTNYVPGQGGTGQLLQGFLEASNVDPVKELVTLIKTQRAFELNSQSIQTADQALQTIANLKHA